MYGRPCRSLGTELSTESQAVYGTLRKYSCFSNSHLRPKSKGTYRCVEVPSSLVVSCFHTYTVFPYTFSVHTFTDDSHTKKDIHFFQFLSRIDIICYIIIYITTHFINNYFFINFCKYAYIQKHFFLLIVINSKNFLKLLQNKFLIIFVLAKYISNSPTLTKILIKTQNPCYKQMI